MLTQNTNISHLQGGEDVFTVKDDYSVSLEFRCPLLLTDSIEPGCWVNGT